MLYQNILREASPYQARVGSLMGFKEHRHADIELSYCIKGELCVEIDKKSYKLRAGEMILVSPMAAHLYPYTQSSDNLVLTVIVGVSFLKNSFTYFTNSKDNCYVFKRDSGREWCGRLFDALDEVGELCENTGVDAELLVRGNLYKICAYLINMMGSSRECIAEGKRLTRLGNIERALELIYYNYTEQITVESAAGATGWGKSNFCKIFKDITGETFHTMLNKKRVESSTALLKETDMPIAEIALAVGFTEVKSFCRVFKSVTSLTPGEYRRGKKHS